MPRRIPLEPEAEKVCIQNAKPPLIFQVPPEEGRQRLERAQDTPVFMYPAEVQKMSVATKCWGSITVYFVIPEGLCERPSVIYYIHGAGWVFGSFHTHEKLVRELAARTGSVVVFPEYSRSPEAKYPVAVEQCYDVLCRVPQLLKKMDCRADLNKLSVAGDSVGGNMATIMTILAKERCGPKICKQLMYYPVTDSCFNTPSYRQFAVDYYLYRAGMMWFWDQYTMDKRKRQEVTASPLRATLEQLRGLPPAMIITDQADVLRDEGECYATKLRKAGVEVTAIRVQAIIHDFVVLNALDQTRGCRIAMDASTQWLNR